MFIRRESKRRIVYWVRIAAGRYRGVTAPRTTTFARCARVVVCLLVISAVTAVVSGDPLAFATRWVQPSSPAERRNDSGRLDVLDVSSVGQLYPGFDGGDLKILVGNPSSKALRFTLGDATVVSEDVVHCASYHIVIGPLPEDVIVAGPHSEQFVLLPGVVSMLASAPDGCQGVAFAINIVATPVGGDGANDTNGADVQHVDESPQGAPSRP